jgi:hypothetical protein
MIVAGKGWKRVYPGLSYTINHLMREEYASQEFFGLNWLPLRWNSEIDSILHIHERAQRKVSPCDII